MLNQQFTKFKVFFVLLVFFVLSVFVTGCANKNDQNNQSDDQNQAQERAQTNQMPNWEDNFDEVDATALVAGQKVMVMGEQNEDGSLVASSIILIKEGEIPFNFGGPNQIMGPPPPTNDGEAMPDQNNNDQQINPGARPDFESMRNMSDEDRQAFRDRMMAEGGGGFARGGDNGTRTRTFAGGRTSRLNGEVLSFSENVLTVKLDDGGSKLVYLTDETKILERKEEVDMGKDE